MSDNVSLSQNRYKAIAALMATSTQQQAALIAGVSVAYPLQMDGTARIYGGISRRKKYPDR